VIDPLLWQLRKCGADRTLWNLDLVGAYSIAIPLLALGGALCRGQAVIAQMSSSEAFPLPDLMPTSAIPGRSHSARYQRPLRARAAEGKETSTAPSAMRKRPRARPASA